MNTTISRCRVTLQGAVLALMALVSPLGRPAQAEPDSAGATASTTLSPDGGRIVVEAHGVAPPAPVFFSAEANERAFLGLAEITGEMRLTLRVIQGRPERLTLGLSGDGDVVEVSGAGLRDWSVRQVPGVSGPMRFLDLRPAKDFAGEKGGLDLVVHTVLKREPVPGTVALLVATPGDAVGFSSRLTIEASADVDYRLASVTGFAPVGAPASPRDPARFFSNGDGRIEAAIGRRGAAPAEAEFVGAQLAGTLAPGEGSVDFRLRGQVSAHKASSRLRVLSGRAAPSGRPAGDGWHLELVSTGADAFAYDLVCDRAGVLGVDLAFAAEVREHADWRSLSFAMPAGTLVALQLEGLGRDVTFKPGSPIVPVAVATGWRGFLPASGSVSLSWKRTGEAAEGALFYTSTEQADVRVGSGLQRQSSRLALRILQGKLAGLRLRLDGPGEILGVEGTNVVGWKVVPSDAGRLLEVRFSRPVEAEGALTVRSQAELGGVPLGARPMRLVPEGAVRHSGYVRIANDGAVRLEVSGVEGMMQLAPEQFPGPAAVGVRQVFVYRFPSAAYAYRVAAAEIQPEVAVSEIATYELSETDRVINASLELDVREAPLRDWSIRIPDDYAVAALTGGEVADFAAESAATDGYRTVKVIFARAVEGRQLLQVRLEKNQAAAAGAWRLRPLRFPAAKSVRGHVGVVSTPGYRITPAHVERLVEVPLSYFPRQTAGLQQAWRLREADWAADVGIDAVGQSIQADVFHLYTVKEGIVYGSVLLNYFVVGAPATEWRVQVPKSVGNIDVTGQNVQRDWRREGDQVIVSLHQPVLGGATLLITFEQPMSARGGTISPGEVRPLGVQGERGYLEVVSPLQVKTAVRRAEGGLLKLEATELPPEFRLLNNSPVLAVYQYTARPFGLEVGLDWYAPGETVDQAVDFARLSSEVSRDGQVVTEAQYYVKTQGRKALRIILPEGVRLWETRVDNEVAMAQADGGATLIPLPARLNANEPVAVVLRLGQGAGASPSSVRLVAPKAMAPTVVTEWTVHADSGRLLVPRGGNAELVRPALTESGFEWISSRRPLAVASLVALVALGALLLLSDFPGRISAGLVVSAAAAALALLLAGDALGNRRASVPVLTYAASMVAAGDGIAVEVANVGEVRALTVGWGIAAAAAGALLAGAAALRGPTGQRRPAFLTPAAAILLSAGMLAQHGGAALFLAAAAAGIALLMLLPGWVRLRRAHGLRSRTAPPPAGAGAAAAVSLFALALTAGLAVGGTPSARADGDGPAPVELQDGGKASQAMVQTWSIRNDRLFGEAEVTVRGGPGDSFLLLRPPAILTEFKGEGLRLAKVERDGRTAYYVVPEREGVLSARVRFEMAVADRARGIALPIGPAATQRITLELDQGGWEFASKAAVQILETPGLGEGRSGATLVLAPQSEPVIHLRPKRRNAADEATQFYAEASNLFVPGPGVVDGYARVTVKPAQGRVSELDLDVPKGFTVGEVSRGPVGAWRFDPQTRRLHVAIEPAQTEAFRFDIESQLGAGALPFDLSLEPLWVAGAAGQVGLIAIAFGPDAQPEQVTPADLSAVNVQDFDAGLLPRGRDDKPQAVVQQAWRYGQARGRVELRVAGVAPEVRIQSRQLLSLDDDRLVMAVDLHATITRAGLFRLSFALPEGLELEALSGASLSQWTEAQEGSQRMVTMNLIGRTIGEQAFSLTLTGAAPRTQPAWLLPRLLVREAKRQAGEVVVVPGRGLRLRVTARDKATQIDPRSVGGLQPGTLAFRLLEDDGSVRLGIEALEPWVTVQSLQEVAVREGQTLERIGLRCRVENAAVKLFRIRLPGMTEDQARTVRATGSAVSDIIRVPGAPDMWDVRFQRGIAGETDVQIEFQGPAGEGQERASIVPPEYPGARQVVQFVAVRAGGRLELEADTVPRGWARQDWNGVPPNLLGRTERSVPALCFRVAEPEGALTVAIRRHDVAEALKLRVTQADLTTVFSAQGFSLTAVELKIDVLEKGTLRVRLPAAARLFATRVNGENASVVREGDAYLFNVTANADSEHSAEVRLVYSVAGSGGGAVALAGPGLSVPLENVTWRVVIPPGYDLRRHEGGFRLVEERAGGSFGIEQYKSLIVSKHSADAEKAVALLEQANTLLQSGNQERAGEMFSRASNAQGLDEASNEDARVQLRNLRTQQTVLGLNTRRQKLYLDNRVDAARNEQLEQAASLNPYMQGKLNFDPQQIDQLLMGNTVEENAALRGIASRLVDQQLADAPAPVAIDVTLPERGRVLTFARRLQVDGGAPLELRLTVAPTAYTNVRYSLFLVLAIALVASIPLTRRAAGP